MVWNKDAPLGSIAANQIDESIRETRTDIETALRAEGIFPGTDPANPVFRWTGKRGNTAARPASPGLNELYFNTELKALEYFNGSTWAINEFVTPDRSVTGPKIGLQAVVAEHLGTVAGAGMAGGNGVVLTPNTDGTTIQVNPGNGQLRIVPGSITATQLATGINIPGNFTATTRAAFAAYLGIDQDSVTGDGTLVTVPFNTTIFDNGGNYSTSSFYLQAPVTGRYFLSTTVCLKSLAAPNKCELIFATTGGNYVKEDWPTSEISPSFSQLVNMTQGDTALVQVKVSGGARLVSIKGVSSVSSFTRATSFSGFLVT